MAKIKLFSKRKIWLPTWQGGLLLLTIFILVISIFMANIHDYLSINRPIEARALLVDDWLPDFAIEGTLIMFQNKECNQLIITGGHPVYGWNATKYSNSAELLAAKFIERGLDGNKITIIKVSSLKNDRTKNAAEATKNWYLQNQNRPEYINVVTIGPHARRSLYLFNKALKNYAGVGIISIESIEYDKASWWRTSQGLKEIITETIAYIYTILFL